MNQLPIKPENLKAIQDGLRGVITSPKGDGGLCVQGFSTDGRGQDRHGETRRRGRDLSR